MSRPPARAPSAAAPPRLQLPLWRNLGMMALVNVLPLAALAWFLVSYDQGFHLRHHQPGLLPAIIAVLGACAVIALSAWVLMPVARWLRAYPRWQYRHSRWWALWILPAILGELTWVVVMLLAVGVVVMAVAVVVAAVHSVGIHPATAVSTPP